MASFNSNNTNRSEITWPPPPPPEADDGISFGSDITVSPDDVAEMERTNGTRYWGPDAVNKGGYARQSENNLLETSIDDVMVASGGSDSRGETRNRVSSSSTQRLDESLPGRICKVITKLLPSLCITCVIQFIDLSTGVSFYLIGLVIFQVLFWPSVSYVLYSKFVSKRQELLEPVAKFRNGHWIHFFLLQVHSALVVGATLLQILSLQYLDVTVSLALSFLPVIVLILIEHIVATKGCSVELLVSLVVGYAGMICAALPALLTSHPYLQWRICSGLAASIGSSLLTIQASLLLKYFRHRRTDDSLLTLGIGLKGTIVCLIAGLLKGAIGPIDSQNSGYVAATSSFGTLAAFLLIFKLEPAQPVAAAVPKPGTGTTETTPSPEVESGPQDEHRPSFPLGYICVLHLRLLVFVFSLLWAILKQFYRHRLPSVFSVLGVTLITCALLLAIAFREWYALVTRSPPPRSSSSASGEETSDRQSSLLKLHHHQQQQQHPSLRIFQFVPWLFSRRPILHVH